MADRTPGLEHGYPPEHQLQQDQHLEDHWGSFFFLRALTVFLTRAYYLYSDALIGVSDALKSAFQGAFRRAYRGVSDARLRAFHSAPKRLETLLSAPKRLETRLEELLEARARRDRRALKR